MASGADISVTTTGYAGPEDGEDGTPAGTVYIGTAFVGAQRAENIALTVIVGRYACRQPVRQ